VLLLYLALVIAAGGLVAQMWAQARLSPTRSALILALEPVFAAAAAITFGGEPLTWRLAVGGSLIVGAIAVSEFAPGRTRGARIAASTHPVPPRNGLSPTGAAVE